MSSPIERADGTLHWAQQPGDQYVVTGTDTRGKRFRLTCPSWRVADSVNLYRGSKWLLRDGKRYLIVQVYND